MTLHETIKDGIKSALKAHDETRLLVMRGLSAAFTNELVNTKRKPADMLSDDEALTVITRLAKQRKDSIDQFNAGGRADLADNEAKELAILQEFLPTMMPIEEVRKLAEAKKNELGIIDASKKGMLVGALMKDLKGKADGGDVKNAVDELFSK